ncbi:MAG TPA: hypothetical protein VE890_04300, partial [Thermoguttaceae bacterium]|nr:hypothetical protein [Thermoguttaceae bacterium]
MNCLPFVGRCVLLTVVWLGASAASSQSSDARAGGSVRSTRAIQREFAERTTTLSDEQLLTTVQRATFGYFWDYGHPTSGLARERTGSRHLVTTGGSGFGLMTIVVGAERGFVSRDEAARRVLRIVTFMRDKAQRYHGVWSHWLNGETGQTVPFSRYDDG